MNLTFFLFSYLVIQSVPVNFSLSKNNNQLVFFQSMCLVIKSHQLTGLCWCLCLCVCVCVCVAVWQKLRITIIMKNTRIITFLKDVARWPRSQQLQY